MTIFDQMAELLGETPAAPGAAQRSTSSVDVRAIRMRTRLTQEAFAARFGLSARTVAEWEQERRTPDRATCVLYRVIDAAPNVVAAVAAGK